MAAPLCESKRMLFVGIDIAKASAVAALLSSDLLALHIAFDKCPILHFDQSRSGFESLLTLLATHAKISECRVLLENTGHYGYALEQFLQEKGIVVYRVHVHERARKQKSDTRDARALAVLLFNQLERAILLADPRQIAHKLTKPSATARLLHGLVQHHYELKRETTRRKNKLTAITDELFPELTQVYANPNSPSALALRTAFPSSRALLAATLDELAATRKRTFPSRTRLSHVQALAAHTIGTKDESRITSLLIEQKQLIAELTLLDTHLEQLDAEIAKAVAASREGQILTSFPCIGAIQAAHVIAQMGDISNFESIPKLRAYCGWAPSQQQTGTSKDSMSLQSDGNHVLKHTIFLITLTAIRLDTPWRTLYRRLVPLKCTYDHRLKRYKGRMKVIGRVAGQIIGLIYTLLKRDELYDPTKHHVQQPPSSN